MYRYVTRDPLLFACLFAVNVPVGTPAETEKTAEPSRPASPLAAAELVNGGAVLAAALHKKMNRKRKATVLESEVC